MRYLGFVLLFSIVQLSAQEALQENWFTNLEAATAYASTSETNILMVFAGSDWCRPCIQFKQDILASEVFKAFAKDNLTILYLDFPSRRKNQLSAEQKQHNEALAEKYNGSGAFPHIVLMNVEGEVLAQPSFKGQTPSDFISQLNVVSQ
jgi:thioredoxin-related protein